MRIDRERSVLLKVVRGLQIFIYIALSALSPLCQNEVSFRDSRSHEHLLHVPRGNQVTLFRRT